MARSPALRFPKSLWSSNPIPRGCTLYLPLWSPGLNGDAFKSADPFGRPMVVTGALHKAQGRFFDGSDDKIVYTGSLGLTDGGTFSSFCWVKSEVVSTVQLVGREAINQEWHYYLTSRKLRLRGSGVAAVTSDNTLPEDVWHFVGVTLDGTSGILYEEGVSVKSGTIDVLNDDTTKDLSIGFLTGGTQLQGTIGEVYIYNRILTADEILYMYHRTRGRFL